MFDLQFDAGDILQKLNNIQAREVITAAANEAALQFDNKARENINERIYQQPPSLTYIRTGRALGGSNIEDLGDGKKIVWDSRLKVREMKGVTGGLTITGARKRSKRNQKEPAFNYTPFLNKNSKIGKLNTNFFDDAVDFIKDESSRILENTFKEKTNV